MLEGIYRLVRKGFPLNADKLMLVMRTVTILGFLLCQVSSNLDTKPSASCLAAPYPAH